MRPNTEERMRRQKRVRQPLLYLGMTMTVVYVFIGAYLLSDKSYFRGFDPEFLNIFAVVLIVYGFYRGWRTYSDYVQ